MRSLVQSQKVKERLVHYRQTSNKLQKKRVLETVVNEQEYRTVTVSTPYVGHDPLESIKIELQPSSKVNIRDQKDAYKLKDIDFNAEYQKINEVIESLLPKKKKEKAWESFTESWRKEKN